MPVFEVQNGPQYLQAANAYQGVDYVGAVTAGAQLAGQVAAAAQNIAESKSRMQLAQQQALLQEEQAKAQIAESAVKVAQVQQEMETWKLKNSADSIAAKAQLQIAEDKAKLKDVQDQNQANTEFAPYASRLVEAKANGDIHEMFKVMDEVKSNKSFSGNRYIINAKNSILESWNAEVAKTTGVDGKDSTETIGGLYSRYSRAKQVNDAKEMIESTRQINKLAATANTEVVDQMLKAQSDFLSKATGDDFDFSKIKIINNAEEAVKLRERMKILEDRKLEVQKGIYGENLTEGDAVLEMMGVGDINSVKNRTQFNQIIQDQLTAFADEVNSQDEYWKKDPVNQKALMFADAIKNGAFQRGQYVADDSFWNRTKALATGSYGSPNRDAEFLPSVGRGLVEGSVGPLVAVGKALSTVASAGNLINEVDETGRNFDKSMGSVWKSLSDSADPAVRAKAKKDLATYMLGLKMMTNSKASIDKYRDDASKFIELKRIDVELESARTSLSTQHDYNTAWGMASTAYTPKTHLEQSRAQVNESKLKDQSKQE